MMQRTIALPALGKAVPLGVYVKAIKHAKANPGRTFKCGLTTWWPTTGAEVLEQFREGMTQRINQAIPYCQRGKAPICSCGCKQ